MQRNEGELNWQIETYLFKLRSQFKFASINEFRIELFTNLAAHNNWNWPVDTYIVQAATSTFKWDQQIIQWIN